MNTPVSRAKARDVPSTRFSRAARFGTMAAGVAGNMALGGLAQLSRGQRPSSRDLLLTPRNIMRVTDELAKMRGAAMKIGQLVSMDTGDVLPPELTDIMARLRADADFMPPKQLRTVLDGAWGKGWHSKFKSFDVRPIAAASIGQVHKAVLKSGETLAIKVQYPGIASSIDSDVANVGRLIKLSGLLPAGFELDPYLEEARKQLHDEADYALEARHLNRFWELLDGDPAFLMPQVFAELSTRTVLSMTFIDSQPIEHVEERSQAERNSVMTRLFDLTLRELFEFGVMQTDPNFANYRHAAGKIVLLDFGATRDVSAPLAQEFADLLRAGLSGTRSDLERAAVRIGLMPDDTPEPFRAQIINLITMVFEEIRAASDMDFAQSDLTRRMHEAGQKLADDGYVPAPIPIELLFVQRKVAGIFLLANRLRAVVPVENLIAKHL